MNTKIHSQPHLNIHSRKSLSTRSVLSLFNEVHKNKIDKRVHKRKTKTSDIMKARGFAYRGQRPMTDDWQATLIKSTKVNQQPDQSMLWSAIQMKVYITSSSCHFVLIWFKSYWAMWFGIDLCGYLFTIWKVIIIRSLISKSIQEILVKWSQGIFHGQKIIFLWFCVIVFFLYCRGLNFLQFLTISWTIFEVFGRARAVFNYWEYYSRSACIYIYGQN